MDELEWQVKGAEETAQPGDDVAVGSEWLDLEFVPGQPISHGPGMGRIRDEGRSGDIAKRGVECPAGGERFGPAAAVTASRLCRDKFERGPAVREPIAVASPHGPGYAETRAAKRREQFANPARFDGVAGPLKHNAAGAEGIALPTFERLHEAARGEGGEDVDGWWVSHATRSGVAGVHGSRTHPRPLVRPRNRFEDGGSHRAPSTPAQTVTVGAGSNHCGARDTEDFERSRRAGLAAEDTS